MELSTVDLIFEALDRFGILGAVILALCVLGFTFGHKYVSILAEKAADFKVDKEKGFWRNKRKDAVFKVYRLLRELMDKLHANRISVFEYHNGGYNLTGMPFLHFSVKIQMNEVGVDELSKDFENVFISAIPEFIEKLNLDEFYYASVEELKNIFPRMYRELSDDDIKYIICSNIEGANDEIGFIMLQFKHPIDITRRKINKELSKKIQKMSIYLDGRR